MHEPTSVLHESNDAEARGKAGSVSHGATIRVNQKTRDRLAERSRATGRPMTELLEDAADALERRLFFDQLAARYSELRGDRQARAAISSTENPTIIHSMSSRRARTVTRALARARG
jgi:hypothetical protein